MMIMGKHKAKIEDYRAAVKVIEEEFGLRWLRKKVKTAKKRGHWGLHPVPKEWKETKEALEEYTSTGFAPIRQSLIALASFAYNLRQVRPLPNYSIAIRPRLRKANEFPKVQYEVYLGALGLRSGHRVEFIVPSTTHRTADLKLLSQNLEVFVECKRKDDYLQSQDIGSGDAWHSLKEGLLGLRQRFASGYEITVIVPGVLEKKSVPAIGVNFRPIWVHRFSAKWVHSDR
jgi:uncharacterized protein (DUF1330 family)